MTYKDGEYYGTVSDLPKDAKHKKSLCCFCNTFRNGNEIVFATNTLKNQMVNIVLLDNIAVRIINNVIRILLILIN